jgi:hypothetical protein
LLIYYIPTIRTHPFVFSCWLERKQRDGCGKKGNSTFSFFNLKFNLNNMNEKNLKSDPI